MVDHGLGMEGRRILVTGAAQGIGRATALKLSGLGARLVLADLQDCAAVAEECGGGAVATRIDLAEDGTAARLVEGLAAEEPLWGVVNCAGLILRRDMETITEAEIQREIAVNQIGCFNLARAALAAMRPAGGGRIVLVTSQGAFTGGFHGSVTYAMTKAAVGALIKTLARAGAADDVTANAIAPGAIDTAMLRSGMTEDDLASFRTRIPLGRFGTPQDVAGAAAFLLSDWAGFVTGATIHVNGGQLMV